MTIGAEVGVTHPRPTPRVVIRRARVPTGCTGSLSDQHMDFEFWHPEFVSSHPVYQFMILCLGNKYHPGPQGSETSLVSSSRLPPSGQDWKPHSSAWCAGSPGWPPAPSFRAPQSNAMALWCGNVWVRLRPRAATAIDVCMDSSKRSDCTEEGVLNGLFKRTRGPPTS